MPSAEAAQKAIDSAVGQGMQEKRVQYLRTNRNNLRAGREAFRELRARSGGRDHDVAFTVTRFEQCANFGDRIAARLALRIEILQRDSHHRCARLRCKNRLCAIEHEVRADVDAFEAEPVHRNPGWGYIDTPVNPTEEARP